ncbi:Hpt domain-containing protein [Vibrio sp.]|uniref:Hpt domain-containing protein n=1 Tax=Vibrio viridaestus TaxID=2487322 RepID=A0A3N9TFV0_9VIBR|nr:Hpt domain-containing protein [Vibrio viridaestus]MDC0612539.1 Hpt domain-containing protein [Vibrio sp.]RQW63137.1 Hpt domain-containing protein [Vibrio viridaestus]
MEVLKNQQTIDELANEIGAENIPMLLAIFLNELSEYLDIFNHCEDSQKVTHLTDISHALKSSAASFGADALCQLAISIDSKAKQDTLSDINSEVKALTQLIEETRSTYERSVS